MNNFEIGIDIVENKRFINKEKLIKRFLSLREHEKISEFSNVDDALAYISGRWAAKEAIVKATKNKYLLKQIEILNSSTGEPMVFISGEENKKIKISISHEKNYTVALCFFII